MSYKIMDCLVTSAKRHLMNINPELWTSNQDEIYHVNLEISVLNEIEPEHDVVNDFCFHQRC